ncbi:MAG: gamma-glutamyl-gamma-aminobutyrate hydrolase family protein [Dysgonamonadaceae bacterium]|nr:gamma-glutamyl-gamma-aminobutyrate hydrolase family protein [Dysgonamonadaceae bacterium]
MKNLTFLLIFGLFLSVAVESQTIKTQTVTAISRQKASIDSLEIALHQTAKPLIGISVGRTQSGGSTVSATYINAVLQAGGIPILIPAISDGAAIYETVATLDGLIMTGGEDINPLWFDEAPIPELGEVDDARDEYEIRLIKMAVDRNIPMLGICRGEQVINVVLGGSLYQDIPSQRDTSVHHRQNLAGKFASHEVSVLPTTQLAEIIGEGGHGVNSFHHQAVKDLAPGLMLAATAPDGVVEAYEAYPNHPIIGVQWHPEILITGDHPKMMHIFRFLLEKAKTFKKAKALHAKIISIDTHVDTPTRFGRPGFNFADREANRTNLPKIREGYLDGVFLAAFIDQGKRDAASSQNAVLQVMEMLNTIRSEIAKHSDLCELALTPDDLVRIKSRGKTAMFIGIENGYAIGKDLSNLKKYYDLGVRYMTLSHMYDNDICDTSTHSENEWGGLSPFGKKVVKEMNKVGMMVDVSHVSESTFWDVLKVTKVPVICSHSSVKALCNSDRNLTDEQLKALAKNGGVVHICIVDEFLTDNPKDATIEDLMRHIDHAVNVAGIDHVGIGSDFDGGGGVPGCQSANDLIQITVKLLERGYSEEDIAKIWGGNLLRVMHAVQKEAK